MFDRFRIKPEIKLLTAHLHLELKVVSELDLLPVVNLFKVKEESAIIFRDPRRIFRTPLSTGRGPLLPLEYVLGHGIVTVVAQSVDELNEVFLNRLQLVNIDIERAEVKDTGEGAHHQTKRDQLILALLHAVELGLDDVVVGEGVAEVGSG